MTTPIAAPDVRVALPAALIHDLRTPLSHIIGYSELLIEQAQESGREAEVGYLMKVRAAGYLLVGMIEDNFHAVRVLDAAAAIAARGEPMPEGAPPGSGTGEAAT